RRNSHKTGFPDGFLVWCPLGIRPYIPLLAVMQGEECAYSKISALRVGTYTVDSSVTVHWTTTTVAPTLTLQSGPVNVCAILSDHRSTQMRHDVLGGFRIMENQLKNGALLVVLVISGLLIVSAPMSA